MGQESEPALSGEVAIGARLRAARQAMGWSLEEVAGFVGVTKGFISRLERDDVSPSLQSLVKLCRVLRITVNDLLAPSEGALVPWEQNPVISLGGISQRALTPSSEPDVALVRIRIDPGADRRAEQLYTIDSDTEVLHVIDGRLRLVFSDRAIDLGPGDTYTFRGREPQRLENAEADRPVDCVIALAPAPRSWSPTTARARSGADGSAGVPTRPDRQ
ncbi:helix-turn-helix domain-containing protein [Blastococcus sp. SYSU D00820]